MNVEEILGPRPQPQDDPAVLILGPRPETGLAPVEPQRSYSGPERIMRNAIGGSARTLAAMIEGVAIAPDYKDELGEIVGSVIPAAKPTPKPVRPLDEDMLFRFAQTIRRSGDRWSPPPEAAEGELSRFLTSTLPQAGGSMATMVGAGAALRKPLGATRAVALTGAAVGAGDAFTDAKRHGADDETALFSAMVGAGLGATEAVPIAKWLAPRGGGRVLMRALREGSEEMIQEFVQQLGNNIVAEQQFDPGRPWIQGAGEGAAAGLTLGTLGSLLASVVGGRKGRGLRPATSSTTTETTDTPIEKAFEERLKEQVGEAPTATPPTETTAPVAQPPVLPTKPTTEQSDLQSELDAELGQDETTGEVVPTEQAKPVDIAEELLGPPPVDVQPKSSVLFPPPTGDDSEMRVRQKTPISVFLRNFSVFDEDENRHVVDPVTLAQSVKSGTLPDVSPGGRALMGSLLEQSKNHPLKGIWLYDTNKPDRSGSFTQYQQTPEAAIRVYLKDKQDSPISTAQFARILNHELVHNAVTSKFPFADSALQTRLDRLFEFAKRNADKELLKHNAFKSNQEFMADALSSKKIRDFLVGLDYSSQLSTDTKLPTQRRTAFGGLLEIVRRLLGLSRTIIDPFTGKEVDTITALDEAISLADSYHGVKRGSLDSLQLKSYRSSLFPPPTGDDPNIRVRQFANQLAEEPTVSDVAKGRIANALYRRRPQEDDIAMARRLIDEAGGPEQAVSIFNDQSNDVHPSVRTFMGEQIIKDLGAQAREAETKGDAARADQLINRQVEFIDTFLPFTSESGYRLGNLAVFSKLSPRTHVARYKKLINQNKKEERQAFVENVEQAKADLAAGASPAEAAAGAEQRTPSRHRKKTPWKRIVSVIQKTPGIDTEKVWNAVAPGLGLPAFDPKAVKQITKLANEAASKPEGFQQDRAVKDLMTFVEQSTGDSLSEFLWAIYYARLLSGLPTHLLNIGSNTAQIGASYLSAAIQHPTDAAALGRALISGLGQAVPEIADVLKTGRVTGVRMLKAEPAGILERTQRGGLFKLLKHWRVVARAMAAEDLAAFMPLHEMRSVQLAREQARKEGLKGQAFHDRVAELLGQTPANVARAKQVATSEGHKGLNYKRRVDEFQRQQRDPRMRENARDYALRNTFNSKPYGLLGDFASALKYFNARHPWMRVVTPFIDVMANVANEGLNYTPLVPNRTFGAIKAMGQDWRGKKVTGQVYGRDAQHGDAEEMIFKQIAGMGLMGLLGQMIAGGWGKPDEEKWIDISGPGPTQPESKDQLRATGWLPFSIRIGGKWFPYSETQVGMALGALGTYFDAVRYGRLGNKSELAKIQFLAQGAFASFANRTSITALNDFTEAITNPRVRKDETTFKALGRLSSGVLSSRVVSFFDRLEDPKAYEDNSGFDSALLSNTAVVRRWGKPKLNVFGEPVMRKPLDRFMSSTTDDRLAQTLAKRNIWIPLQTGEELGGSVYRPFTADEQYRFVQLRGPALRQALTRVLPTLNRLETAKAQSFARAIIEAETLRAKAKVVAERGITRKER